MMTKYILTYLVCMVLSLLLIFLKKLSEKRDSVRHLPRNKQNNGKPGSRGAGTIVQQSRKRKGNSKSKNTNTIKAHNLELVRTGFSEHTKETKLLFKQS